LRRSRDEADEDALTPAVVRWAALGTIAQVALVTAGHYVDMVFDTWPWPELLVAAFFGSGYVFQIRRSYVDSAWHGGMVGGICSFLGVALAVSLADVAPNDLATLTLAAIGAGAVCGLVVFWAVGPDLSH
jgi:hypothetical protein